MDEYHHYILRAAPQRAQSWMSVAGTGLEQRRLLSSLIACCSVVLDCACPTSRLLSTFKSEDNRLRSRATKASYIRKSAKKTRLVVKVYYHSL